MTEGQIAEATKLIGKMPREEIAERVGVSVSSLKRAFRGTRLAYQNRWVANPALVKRVCAYYEKNGRVKTAKAFPGVKVRSVVERYKNFLPRQTRWTEPQLIEVARMAGLVGFSDQARFFRRPGAHEGAIRSVWVKRFKSSGGGVHGMSDWMAKHLVTERCPRLVTDYWTTSRGRQRFGRKLCLWVDMERHMRRGVPPFVADAIRTMAQFQRWLFQSDKPKRAILAMIAKRARHEKL